MLVIITSLIKGVRRGLLGTVRTENWVGSIGRVYTRGVWVRENVFSLKEVGQGWQGRVSY